MASINTPASHTYQLFTADNQSRILRDRGAMHASPPPQLLSPTLKEIKTFLKRFHDINVQYLTQDGLEMMLVTHSLSQSA